MTVMQKMGLLLLLPLLCCILSLALFKGFLDGTRGEAHFMNVAGRQRMLSAEMLAWAQMVAGGQDEDRQGLRFRADQFEDGLASLRRGGRGEDVAAIPVPAEVAAELDVIAGLWQIAKADVDSLVVAPRDDVRFQDAYKQIQVRLPDLKDRSHHLTLTFEARAENMRRGMFAALMFIGIFVGLIFIIGLMLTDRYVVQPLLGLGEAAQRIGDGDFSQPLDCTTHDELSTLVAAFNQMSTRIEKLLKDQSLRRKHAEAVIECIPVGLLVLRHDLTAIGANQALRETLGVADEALKARPLEEIMRFAGLQEAALKVLESGEPSPVLHFETGSQSLRVTMASAPAEEEGGQPELLLAVEDLTAEARLTAQLKESERRFQDVMETATDGVILMDVGGCVTYMNRAAEKMFGWERQELVGQSGSLLMPEKYREAHEQGVAHQTQPGAKPVSHNVKQTEGLRKDGGVFPLEYTVSAADFAGEKLYLGIMRDLSQAD